MLIFLPSRRAVRTIERALANAAGGACILPKLVALGEGVEDTDQSISNPDIISDTERVVALAGLLTADANIGDISTAMPIARDLVRMTNYMENDGIDISTIDWPALVDEKYAAHFQHKAKLLNILSTALPAYYNGRITQTEFRNRGIRAWINEIDNYKLVVVCGSTASVPATADLMRAVARVKHGIIILPGKISGRECDFELETNPYHCEYKFLSSINVSPTDVKIIDVGPSAIDFMNIAFGNDGTACANTTDVAHCHIVECDRESEEAAAIAEIAMRARADNKSVLIITPDAAGNQRIATAFAAHNITADFSGGQSATMSNVGRALLNMFDQWIETNSDTFDKILIKTNGNLFNAIAYAVESNTEYFAPQFKIDDPTAIDIWIAINHMSQCVANAGLPLNTRDARTLIADAISSVTVRNAAPENSNIIVLGTIESRIQTADIVILSGLNDGMFPARGYENAWLPRKLCEKIGLPPADRKVSLMSLDFMNLSCGPDVYWTRSRTSGGVATLKSRFLSRVDARRGEIDATTGRDILSAVRKRDDVAPHPLDYSAPTPPADWSPVYVTELETLIHNPYAFYASHILRLRPGRDYWDGVDARDFGKLVHGAVEKAHACPTPSELVAEMDKMAHELLGTDSVLFHFWHRRFLEIAPIIATHLAQTPNAYTEIDGGTTIAGRMVRARADRIWDGGVMDIKTGAAPTKKQLMDGNMPQLGLEAYILKSGGFSIPTTHRAQTPVMTFLQLRTRDARAIEYDAATTAMMIDAAVERTTEIINMYSAGAAAYEYHETSDMKYRAYDDLARVRD